MLTVEHQQIEVIAVLASGRRISGSHDHPPTNTLPSVRVGRFLSAKDLRTVRLVYGNFGEPTIATLVDAHIKNRTKFLSGHNSEYARSKSLYLTVTRPLNS